MKKSIILIGFLFLYNTLSKAQTSVLLCEEKYLPNIIDLNFLQDTINYHHKKISDYSFIALSRKDTTIKYWYKHNIDKKKSWYYDYKNLPAPYYIDIMFLARNGDTIKIPEYDKDITDTLNYGFALYISNSIFQAQFGVKNKMLDNCGLIAWHPSNGSYPRSQSFCDMAKPANKTGFVNNCRKGTFYYQFIGGYLFAKGEYSGEYLKIDTSKNGKELLYMDNYGKVFKRELNTQKAIDNLKAKYNYYRFDFTFPILVEFRTGWWEFGNEDGSKDCKILYENGKEVKIEKL